MSQLTLDIDGEILKIWDVSITGGQLLNSAVEAIGRIDKRRRLVGWTAYAGCRRKSVLQVKERGKAPIRTRPGVVSIPSLYEKSSVGSDIAARGVENAIVSPKYRFVIEAVSKSKSRSEVLFSHFRTCSVAICGKMHGARQTSSPGVRQQRVHPGDLVVSINGWAIAIPSKAIVKSELGSDFEIILDVEAVVTGSLLVSAFVA